MSKPEDAESDLRDDYAFFGGVRGKYARRFAEGTNVVVLDPDVAEIFKTSEEANEDLHSTPMSTTPNASCWRWQPVR